ncbi:MAG TPA: pyridoxal phosphate-dependent aminotransferase [Candidatus Krumholzibacteriaceae bacterium]|nr:pyridoxal phosphate-dependent aminotransferase [Candidatus Krumholzibacteriaceae bacterium]
MSDVISERARNIEPSITLSLNTKANNLREAGEDVVGLAAGEPDFETPDVVKEAAYEAIRTGKTRYTPAAGISQLREAVADIYSKRIGIPYKSSEVMISNGAKHSIFNALFVLTNPGDEVLIFTPYWVSYPEMVKLVGAKPRVVKLSADNDYKLTPEKLEDEVAKSKPKAILYNSPNNPAGVVYSADEVKAIGEILRREGISLISDEIYEFLTYEGNKHYSPVSLVPELKDSAVIITGVSKSYAMTGWRIGFAMSGSDVIFRMSAYQAHATGCPNAISQWAALTAVKEGAEDRDMMRGEFEKRKKLFSDRLGRIPGIKYPDPGGAFYFLVDVSSMYGSCGVSGSGEFCEKLLKENGLLLIPGGPFGCDNTIRFSFAAGEEELNKALDRFEEFVGNYT